MLVVFSITISVYCKKKQKIIFIFQIVKKKTREKKSVNYNLAFYLKY